MDDDDDDTRGDVRGCGIRRGDDDERGGATDGDVERGATGV